MGSPGKLVPQKPVQPDGGRPLYEMIYQVLRRHIEDGSLPGGLVLGEAAVARAFRSSRVPAGAALRRLREDGLLAPFAGRGLMVPAAAGAKPLRRDLVEAGLVLPEPRWLEPEARSRRARIYPEVEHLVAASMSYGRFQLNESLLAEHYGVSRTVAHEILTRLDRAGLVTQDQNQRWYTGPLTPALMRDHFELRWMLEPLALAQAVPFLAPSDLESRRRRILALQRGGRSSAKLERLESDLHVDTVLKCRNSQLRAAIHRSQLPLIAIHDTFQLHRDREEIETMLAEHLSVFDGLIEGDIERACRVLEQHLRRSLAPNVARLEALGPATGPGGAPFLISVPPR